MRRDFAVFCLDLDGFKDVNDRHGHAAGDALLIALADRLRDSVRTRDFVSRIGGDEFVILLPAISPAEATILARRIIARVQAPFDVGLQAPVHVGISIGSRTAKPPMPCCDRPTGPCTRPKGAARGCLCSMTPWRSNRSSLLLQPMPMPEWPEYRANPATGTATFPCHRAQNPYNPRHPWILAGS
jgi:hypothetical protein